MTEDSGSILFIVFTADSPDLCLEIHIVPIFKEAFP